MKTNVILTTGLIFVSAHAVGQSRIDPLKEVLGTYVTDTGTGLDTGCSYRSDGPLLIDVPVPAVINPAEIDASGYLKDPQKLIKNKVLGDSVTVLFPAYDIDNEATGLGAGQQPEIDKVSFNGKAYGTGHLIGKDDRWVMQRLELKVKDLKFGPSAKNQLRIDIDTGNVGIGELWCMAVDWVAVNVKVAAPYVLAHGINSDAATWDEAGARGVLTYLNGLGVQYTRFSVTPNGSVEANGKVLGDSIWSWLQTMKSDRVHVIGHSKGGLDAQAMAAQTTKFKVVSLSTLSTPHEGSVASDLSVLELDKVEHYTFIENNGADPNGWVNSYLNDAWIAIKSGQAPARPGIEDLQTSKYLSAVKRGFRGNIVPTYSIGASADRNSNNKLDGSDADGMPAGGSEYLFSSTWRVMREYSSAQFVTAKSSPFGLTTTLVFSATGASTPQDNDIVVTKNSANPVYATSLGNFLANHSTIKDEIRLRKVIDKTIGLQ